MIIIYEEMASYPPPLEFNSIFNEAAYVADTTGITFGQADSRYLKLSGGILSGLLTTAAGISNAGQLIFSAAGNVNNPAIQFVDAKLGIYRHGSNHLRIGVNGTAVQGWAQTYIENLQRVRNVDGDEATPAITFASNQDMGLCRVSASELGISTGGVKRLSVTNTQVSVNLLPFYAENYKSNNIGAAGNTVYGSLTSDLGMYFDLNRINFSTNAVERLNIQNTAITSSVKMLLPDSGVGFSSSPNTMLTYTGSNRIGMYCNNSLVLQLTPTAIDCRQPVNMFNLGSAAAPQIINASNTTTGLYWTTGVLNVSVAGTQRVSFASDGVRLYGSTAGNNALYVPSPLQYYEEYDYATTFGFTGGNQTPTINCKITRIGNIVTLVIPYWNAVVVNNTGVARACVSASFIPTRFLPGNQLPMVVSRSPVNGAESLVNMYIIIGANYLVIEKGISGNFANGESIALYGISMTWYV